MALPRDVCTSVGTTQPPTQEVPRAPVSWAKRSRREAILVLRSVLPWRGHRTTLMSTYTASCPQRSSCSPSTKLSNQIIRSAFRGTPCVPFFRTSDFRTITFVKQIRLGINWGWLHSESFVWGCAVGVGRGGNPRILEKVHKRFGCGSRISCLRQRVYWGCGGLSACRQERQVTGLLTKVIETWLCGRYAVQEPCG